MNIDYNKIEEIYGIGCLMLINKNREEIQKNINYLYKLGFEDIKDIFERKSYIFIKDNEEFKENINNLIKRIGMEYVEIIENDLSLLEELE